MYYDTSDAPAGTKSSRLVTSVKAAVGSIETLDESPATFTQLEITDPTVEVLAPILRRVETVETACCTVAQHARLRRVSSQ